MSTIQMKQSNIHECEKLFGIIQKYGVHCSLEFKVEENADPLLGIAQASVKVDYFEDQELEAFLLIDLNGSDFSFSGKKSTFHKYVSDCQIDICISSELFSAWFNSGSLPAEAIEEANGVSESPETVYELDRSEQKFLGEIDGLLFDLSMDGRYIKEFDGSTLGKYHIVVASRRA